VNKQPSLDSIASKGATVDGKHYAPCPTVG
jgi:hypothetical protein